MGDLASVRCLLRHGRRRPGTYAEVSVLQVGTSVGICAHESAMRGGERVAILEFG